MRSSYYVFYANWFLFDSAVFFVMFVEVWAMSVWKYGGSTISDDSPWLKVLRALTVTRVFRVYRMFPELAILGKGLVVSFRSVFFCILLILLITYMFAIIMTDLASGSALDD